MFPSHNRHSPNACKAARRSLALSPSDMWKFRYPSKTGNYLLELFTCSFFILVYVGQQAKPVLISISFICTLFNEAQANSTLKINILCHHHKLHWPKP